MSTRSAPSTAPSTPVLVEPTKVRAADGTVQQVSVPAFAQPVRRGSLAEIPFDNAREAPSDAVLSRKQPDGSWQDVTAAEFAAEVLAVAKGLIAEGLRGGDRIAIMARTTYEWTLLDFASWAAGLVTVPIYPTSSAFQARWILQDSGAVACAVETADQGRIISQERKQLGDLTHLWQFDTGALGRPEEARQEHSRRRRGRPPRHPGTGDPGHPHLHLGHHGPPQGLRPDARQLLRRGRQRHRAAAPGLQVRQQVPRLHPPVPAALARLRPDGRDRLPARPGPPRPRPVDPDRGPARRPGRLQTVVPAGDPVRPGEGLQHRPGHRREDGPRLVLRPGRPDRPALRTGRRGRRTRHGPRPRPRPAGGPRALRPPGLPPHPGGPRRPCPVRDLRRLPAGPCGSPPSTRARASRSSRATA